MPSLYGITTMPRLRSRQMLVLVLVVTSLLALGGVSSGQSAAELRAQMKAAIVAAEAALVSEEARLDELAKYNVNRTLADGRPSVAQTASNIRLWEQSIREFEAGERELREALNSTLASLDSNIKQLAQRLSAQREQVEQQITAQQRAEADGNRQGSRKQNRKGLNASVPSKRRRNGRPANRWTGRTRSKNGSNESAPNRRKLNGTHESRRHENLSVYSG